MLYSSVHKVCTEPSSDILHGSQIHQNLVAGWEHIIIDFLVMGDSAVSMEYI